MSFKLPLIFAFSLGISTAFADDDFDLPDDVQKAEVPTSVEDVPDGPVNFAPIEATTTSESAVAPSTSLRGANATKQSIHMDCFAPLAMTTLFRNDI